MQSAIIRGLRNFSATVVALVLMSLSSAFTGLQFTPIDLNNPKKTAAALATALLVGFFTALGKTLRDKYGSVDGTSGVMNKVTL